ncbi:RepB family plasmid replication initiator protein [Burkholderia cenocepacia]|uniref:replication initiation protein n=1 Tax=Burkholderia cenocepacia TaxID=95486 RepID=UPI0023B9273E|nr:RepB family plasmid replication initiator protein [Burkholderia cenocepacia]MDF0506590.1 RepB family plasmid replication initiator protein [Burkholderia cenocepacia]
MPRAKPKTLPPPAAIGGRSEVKKHNNAIHVSGLLSLVGRKLVNVMLLNAYDNLARKREHSIPVALLCDLIGWERSGNIDSLKEALKQIASTPIEFDLFNRAGKPSWSVSTMVAHANIEDGICRYEYSSFLSEKYADPEMYTIINIGMQREFKGNYALSLYENCLRFRGTESGSTGWWPVDTWRKVLGASASLYDEFKFLSNKVIKPAVAEINKISDLIVEPEYKREGRFVTEIRFLVKENPQRSLLEVSADASGAKDSEAYKLLLELGVGKSLALAMVQKDEVRAAEIAQYTKERLESGEIEKSAGGFVRRLYETDAVVKKPTRKAGPKKAQPEGESAEESKSKLTRATLASIPAEKVAELRAAYIEQNPAARFNDETGRWNSPAHTAGFKTFLVSRANQ